MRNVKVSLVTSVRFAKSLQEEKLFRHRGTQLKKGLTESVKSRDFCFCTSRSKGCLLVCVRITRIDLISLIKKSISICSENISKTWRLLDPLCSKSRNVFILFTASLELARKNKCFSSPTVFSCSIFLTCQM